MVALNRDRRNPEGRLPGGMDGMDWLDGMDGTVNPLLARC
jgi:hypothetical protein